MAFIGNQPALAYTSFAVQHFTTSATTSYTLNFPVANENEIRLVINNVVQQPGASYAYSASGTTLTLTAATTVSDTMYAVFLGKAVQTVNPPNGSVGASQLTDGAVTAAKLASGVGGKVLQVVHAVNTTADTSSSGSYAASSLVASITPSSASSKILILLSCSAYASSSGSGGVSHGAIYRQIAAGGYSDIYSPILLAAIKQTSLYAGASSSAEYLDSPNTTSQVDYKLYFKLNSGTDTTLSNDSTKKSFTLLEIAG